MSDPQPNTSLDPIDAFRVRARAAASSASATNLLQAIDTFSSFLGNRVITLSSFDEPLLREWISWLFQEGYSLKTAFFYLKKITSLYNKEVAEGNAPASDAFANVAAALRKLPESIFETLPDLSTLEKLQHLYRRANGFNGESRLATDLVLFSVLNGGLDFERLADYLKDEYTGSDPHIKDIVTRYSSPKNRYLFPLRQSERTPRQMREYIRSLFSAILRLCDIPLSNPIFTLLRPGDTDPAESSHLQSLVNDTICDDPLSWFAMQFRPHVDYDRIRRRLDDIKERVAISTPYYPCGEIARRVKHRLVHENRPVMPGLLFFRSRMSEIAPLFREIGDLAWCYRETNSAGSPYAVIPAVQIDLYQRTIGIFTADTDVRTASAVPLSPSDRVLILGGPFAGYTATVISVPPASDTTPSETAPKPADTSTVAALCRLMLTADSGIEWRIDIDPRLIRPL